MIPRHARTKAPVRAVVARSPFAVERTLRARAGRGALAIGLALIPCLLADSTPARADVATTVVSDATAIIQQLIEDSIAKEAVPNAASKVPATCFYFPSTVGAIEDKRFAALSHVIRKEVADAAGYAVYTAVIDATGGKLGKKPTDIVQDTLRELQSPVLPDRLSSGVPSAQRPATGSPTLLNVTQSTSGLVLDPWDLQAHGIAPQRQCYFGTKADEDLRKTDIDLRKGSVKAAAEKVKAASNDPKANKAFDDAETALETAISATRTDYRSEEAAVNAAIAALANGPDATRTNALTYAETELYATIGTPIATESVATGLLRSCAAHKTGATEIACSVALLVRDAANGNEALLAPDAKRIMTALLARILTKVDQSLNVKATDAEIDALAAAMASADANGVVDSLKAICREDPTCSLWLDAAATAGVPAGEQHAAVAAWVGKAAKRLDLGAVSSKDVDALVNSVTSNDAQGTSAAVGAICKEKATCKGLFGVITGSASGPDPVLAGWIKQAEVLLGLDKVTPAELESLVKALAANDTAAEAAALKDLCGSSNVCSESMAAAQAAEAGQQAVTLEQLLALVATLADNYAKAFPGSCPYCSLVSTLANGADGVVKDIQNKDYGAAAAATFDVVEKMACAQDVTKSSYESSKYGCVDDSDKVVFTFLRSLAVYSVDSVTSGVAQPADADFRNAAVDLIEAYGGQGVRRSLSWKHPTVPLFVPEFSLRAAWRPGLVLASPNSGTASQLITYPSLEMFRFRAVLPSPRYLYLGLHASLVDPLGPFVELATRNANINNEGSLPGILPLALFVPRVDFEVAVPDLSKNLALGVGGAARLYRTEGTTEGGSRYCVPWQSDPACNDAKGNFELSVFAKYVP